MVTRARFAAASRRSLFAVGLASAASLVLRPGPGQAAEPPGAPVPYHGVKPGTEPNLDRVAVPDVVAPEALRGQPHIQGADLYYEVTGARMPFYFEDGFFRQLQVWQHRLAGYLPPEWGTPSRIFTYGAYVNKPGYHGRGRAFDLASVYFASAGGVVTKRFDCRYDQWRRSDDAAEIRVRYWALAASLHHRFRHVLTYLYDSAHHNHIHVDNAVYGSYRDAEFDPDSSSQVQHVQACCRYVWGYSTRITSEWNRQTRRDSNRVLRRFGIDAGSITDDNYRWRMFNYATLLHGTGGDAG